jgi:hypothetical protein
VTTKQGYRVELAPTPEQHVRLGQHAGLSRVVENFCLELVKAAVAQRNAERTRPDHGGNRSGAGRAMVGVVADRGRPHRHQ